MKVEFPTDLEIARKAKLMPMQTRGPPPNVARAYGALFPSSRGEANLSGSNRYGSAKIWGKSCPPATGSRI